MASKNKRTIVDARCDSKGNITHVKLDGNSSFTSVQKAMPIAERGDIQNAHVVHRKHTNNYIRTNPDKSHANNLDEMAKN
ncbi:DUF3892 domain-containing protein [Pseudoalteromonas ruthenica]|uniref:DUF3892 domain-containing protein n=1 Tax=Pseudoalteromonas ruthenica TaxID=151081 RepID=A0A5S3Z8U2_9GAMM|nr:DUF3892 domain-containing protein [Pseudoalteromonas ruthenica]